MCTCVCWRGRVWKFSKNINAWPFYYNANITMMQTSKQKLNQHFRFMFMRVIFYWKWIYKSDGIKWKTMNSLIYFHEKTAIVFFELATIAWNRSPTLTLVTVEYSGNKENSINFLIAILLVLFSTQLNKYAICTVYQNSEAIMISWNRLHCVSKPTK